MVEKAGMQRFSPPGETPVIVVMPAWEGIKGRESGDGLMVIDSHLLSLIVIDSQKKQKVVRK